MKFYLTALLSAIALFASADQASAQQCFGGLGYGPFGGYYNYGIQPYVPAPPYFALHPPVYYGQRFTRPYGDSPFAAPSQLQPSPSYAPSRHVERSLVIQNPYVLPVAPAHAPHHGPDVLPAPANSVPAPVSTTTHSPVAVKPLVIDNPYFQPEAKLADSK